MTIVQEYMDHMASLENLEERVENMISRVLPGEIDGWHIGKDEGGKVYLEIFGAEEDLNDTLKQQLCLYIGVDVVVVEKW